MDRKGIGVSTHITYVLVIVVLLMHTITLNERISELEGPGKPLRQVNFDKGLSSITGFSVADTLTSEKTLEQEMLMQGENKLDEAIETHAAKILSGEVESPQEALKDSLLECVIDSDCTLTKLNECCSCPIAVSKDKADEIDSIPLYKEAQGCEYELCGGCADPDDLRVQCKENKCVAKHWRIAELEERENRKKRMIPIPDVNFIGENPFEEFTIRPACQRGFVAPAIYYELKSTSAVTFQIKELGERDFKDLIEYPTLLEKHTSIIVCDHCYTQGEWGIVDEVDKTYLMRIKVQFKDEIRYSEEFIFDTHENSELMDIRCSGIVYA